MSIADANPDVDEVDMTAGAASRGPRRSWSRTLSIAAVVVMVLAALAVFNLTQGEPDSSLSQVWHALWRGSPEQGVISDILVREVRLPRVIVALMAGASLGLAGVLLQDSLRNPLADPTLLGVAQGAGLIVALISIYPELVPNLPTTVWCFICGTAAGAAVIALSRRARNPVRVVLAGAMVSVLLATLSTAVVLLATQERTAGIFSYYRFVIGSLAAVNWDAVGVVLPWFVVGVPLAFAGSRTLNLLQLGDEAASGMGLRPTRARIVLMLLAMILVTPFVAVIGPIGFVALFAPHISRGLTKTTDARHVLVLSALIGAGVLLVADSAARLLFLPTEVPAGIFTWIIVGPMALVLVGRLGKRVAE
ncbi:MAG: iron ABC transporter permease [Actinomycetota bacterium]